MLCGEGSEYPILNALWEGGEYPIECSVGREVRILLNAL